MRHSGFTTIAFTLSTSPNRLLAVALSRTRRNYTNRERELLNRARPLLIQALRNAIAHDELQTELARTRDGTGMTEALIAAGPTDREAQIIHQLAHGRSKHGIAGALSISQRTVAKHLERCYRKLNVNSQSAAAAKAWDLSERTADTRPATRRGESDLGRR
jgi:ATP/maltotriose-dependent transcriptional regulator MalT